VFVQKCTFNRLEFVGMSKSDTVVGRRLAM
jgi:hypothetical protein